MKYILLLRGINVGGNKKVEMKKLKSLLESLDYQNVSTYLNSGNAIFESIKSKNVLFKEIENILQKTFSFEIKFLLKTEREMQKIAAAIPSAWQNDKKQRTDVAYLFEEVNSKKIIDELLVKKDFIDIRYINGAIYWNVKRENVYKSQFSKIISQKIYQFMTIRNVNTARYLATLKTK